MSAGRVATGTSAREEKASPGEWAVRLSAESAATAGALRLRSGLRAFSAGEFVWLRGTDLGDDLERELRKLPGAVRYAVGPSGKLTAVGSRVPKGELPEGSWVPLAEWIAPAPQPAALAGEKGATVPLRLVRSGRERPAALLVTSAQAWAAYAASAPAVRLKPLKFAACADGRVLLWGTPLPPLPGRLYAENCGVAVPSGFAWDPPADAEVLREVLGLGPGEVALLDEEGGYEHVEAGAFTKATRAATRDTARSLG